MKKFVRFVDAMNSGIAKWACLLILPMVGVTFYEVIMRSAQHAHQVGL